MYVSGKIEPIDSGMVPVSWLFWRNLVMVIEAIVSNKW